MKMLYSALAAACLMVAPVAQSVSAQDFVPGSRGAYPTGGGPRISNSVIGKDQREKIDASKRYDYPFRTVVYISFKRDDGKTGRCTGALIGPDSVLTAASCLSPGKKGKYYAKETYKIVAGLRPGGKTDWAESGCDATLKAVALYAPNGYTYGKGENHNFGVIRLNCNIGEFIGHLGFASLSKAEDLPIGLGGYRTDRKGRTFLWASLDQVREATRYFLFYKNDTGGRGSAEIGSPLVTTLKQCDFCIIGVHGYDQHESNLEKKELHKEYNHGIRITSEVFKKLIDWRK